MDKLFIYFPQWQGSGKTNEIYFGASFLKEKLKGQFQFTDIIQPETEELETDNKILGFARIEHNLKAIRGILTDKKPSQVFTLGGDCGIEVGPVSYLNKLYRSDLCVLWFDAHGDLNTPESSPSKTFHGMPLRVLLGEGNQTILANSFSSLKPEQVILVGTRDLDQPEREYILNQKITLIDPNVLNLEILVNSIKKSGKTNLYIHFDLDVIDPKELPDVKCPTTNGVSMKKLQEIIAYLKSNFPVVGGSIVEYVPKENKAVLKVLKLAQMIFG